MVQQLCIPF